MMGELDDAQIEALRAALVAAPAAEPKPTVARLVYETAVNIVGGLVGVLVPLVLATPLLWLAWNHGVTAAFPVPTLTLVQTLWLLVAARLLKGG